MVCVGACLCVGVVVCVCLFNVFVCECFRCLMRLCGLIVVYCAMCLCVFPLVNTCMCVLFALYCVIVYGLV